MPFWRSCASAIALTLIALVASAEQKPKDHYAEVNGVRLHYIEAGAKGPVVIFLHGFPESWYAWKDTVADFGADHRAIAVDMRGYNLSAHPEGVDKYRIPVLVEDVRALAESLGVKKFTLVGHDWGGVVAWAFAAEHPEMLNYVAVVNAPHPAVLAREIAQNPAQKAAVAPLLALAGEQAEAAVTENNFARLQEMIKGWATPQDRKEYLACWKRGMGGALAYFRAAADPAGMPALKPITVPVMVIWGEKDPLLLPGNLEGLDQYAKDVTIKRIRDGSHWLVHEKPGLVIGYIRDFIRP
jgi:epoxide hydrolase 4